MKKYIWLLILAIIVVLLILLFVPFHQKTLIKTVMVKKGSVSQKVIAVGQILPLNLTKVKSHISGQVGELFADEGNYVKQGQKLLTITPAPTPVNVAEARSDVGTSQAALNGDKLQLQREKTLLARHQIISNDKNYTDAVKTYQSDLATYDYNKEKLELLKSGKTTIGNESIANTIVSPVNGYVLEKNIDQGDSVVPVTDSQAGTVLFVVANLKPLIFKGEVSQIDVNHIKPGMKASLKIASLPKQIILGRVESVSLMDTNEASKAGGASDNIFDTPDVYTHGFNVKIDQLKIPKDVVLRAGYQATATVVTQQKKGVLVLPQGTIHFENDKPYVELLDARGHQRKQVVKIGLSDNVNAEVVSGLKLGDKVVDQ